MLSVQVAASAVAFLQGQTAGSYARGRGSFANVPGALPHGTNGMTAALAGLEAAATATDREMALRRITLLYGLAMAFGGIPLIYMGDELGQGNDATQPALLSARTDARWMQRPCLDEARYAARGDAGTVGGMVFAALRSWLDLRRAIPALRAGVDATALATPHSGLLMLARGAQFLALFNFSEADCSVDLPMPGNWRDASDQRGCGRTLVLAPWQMRWLLG